jgi:hypothetical protein
MSRIVLLLGRRVPLYIGLPIIIASAVTGYVASTTTLYHSAVSETQIRRFPEPSDVGAVSNPLEPSGESVTPGDRSIALTKPEVQLTAPAPEKVERNEAARENPSDATTPVRETRVVPDESRDIRACGPRPSAVRLVA